MSIVAVARRYAEGFLEFARGSIGSERALKELGELKDIFRDNPDFREFFESPEISISEKDDAIDKTLSANFSDEARFFLKLLIKKNRFDRFRDIAEYSRIKYAHGEEVDAILVASYPLDTESISAIKNALEKKFDKKMHLYMNLDSSLLGGVKVMVENKILDGSVRKRLEDMRSRLLAARV